MDSCVASNSEADAMAITHDLFEPVPVVTQKMLGAAIHVARGANSLRSGASYETALAARLRSLQFRGAPIEVLPSTAGASSENDVRFRVPFVDGVIGLEAKTPGGFEGGGVTLKPVDGKLTIQKEGLIKTLYGTTIPWEGRIPSFLGGDKSLETWQAEKASFGDVYIEVPDDSVAGYYRRKGSAYIQVGGKGLYHTGDDVLQIGVPAFEVKTRLRIRTSKHIKRKTGVPADVSVALVFDRKTLVKSPLCLMERIDGSPFVVVESPPPMTASIDSSHTTMQLG
jgi:hypothetical protein